MEPGKNASQLNVLKLSTSSEYRNINWELGANLDIWGDEKSEDHQSWRSQGIPEVRIYLVSIQSVALEIFDIRDS